MELIADYDSSSASHSPKRLKYGDNASGKLNSRSKKRHLTPASTSVQQAMGTRPYVSKRQKTQTSGAISNLPVADLGTVHPDGASLLERYRKVSEIGPNLRALVRRQHDNSDQTPSRWAQNVILKGLTPTKKPITSLRWSNGKGSLLASASLGGEVTLWDAFDKKAMVRCFTSHKAGVKALAWSRDSSSIASSGYDKQLHITNVETGRIVTRYEATEAITALCPVPDDENLLIIGLESSGLRSFDKRTSTTVSTFKGYFGEVQDIAFLPGGQYFVSSSNVKRKTGIDRSLLVWSFDTGAVVSNQLYMEAFTCPSIRVSKVNKTLFAQSHGNYIAQFSIEPPYRMNKYKRFEGHTVAGSAIQFSLNPAETILATGSIEGAIYYYDVRSTRMIHKQSGLHSSLCSAAEYHPVLETTIATADWDGNIAIQM